jgi:bifunctional non-homologous end joining protein LigD
VRSAALLLRQLLEDDLGLGTFVKTTGGKGLHMHVPLDANADFDSARGFAHDVAGLLAARNLGLVTTEQRRDKRGKLIYLDVMRNAYAQLAVAPYSVRARPGAPVATRLHWDELADDKLQPGRFTLVTVPARISDLSGSRAPWAGMGKRGSGLAGARESLRRLAARRTGESGPTSGRKEPR